MIDIRKKIETHYIWVKVKTNDKEKLLYRLYKKQVEVYETAYDKQYILLKVNELDYKKCKRITYYNFSKVKEAGIYSILYYIKKNYLILMTMIIFLFFINIFSHIIVKVTVIHANKEIRELVTKDLDELGIRFFTLKKDFEDLEEIKNKILAKNKDKLEWLEIETKGMTYIVRVEERIKTQPKEEKDYCHLIATKSGIVKKIIHQKGDIVVNKDDYVSEGDILISGQIMANEEVKNNVCAKGEVYAEVWYKTKISIPLKTEEKVKTGKTRNNFKLKSNTNEMKILKPRLKTYVDEDKKLFSLFHYDFYLTKESEVNISEKELSEEEALTKALGLVDEKIKEEVGKKGEVMNKKVLKKSVNNSTMDIEVFVSVLEQISKEQEFVVEDTKEGA